VGRWVVVGALAAALAAGCGGSEADEPAPVSLDGEPVGSAAPEPGQTVLRFVQAARRGDALGMWTLLSKATHASFGPSLRQFSRGTAPELAENFEDFRQARVALSRVLGERWAVGAVVGRYETDEDEPEPAAYAAALRREDGRWRLELGGVVIARLEPDPLEEVGRRPELRAEAEAGREIDRMLVWLDGRPVAVRPERKLPFTAEIQGVPERPLEPGDHAMVVFAETRDTAGALAWPFEVND
jgi:hypothetical protein